MRAKEDGTIEPTGRVVDMKPPPILRAKKEWWGFWLKIGTNFSCFV
jgi:hypothetical protein